MSVSTSFFILVGRLLLRLLAATLHFHVDDQAGLIGKAEPKTIWLLWHNRLLMVPEIAYRYVLKDRKGCVLTSASKDGELVARFVQGYGLETARGSSSRRGAAAMLELIRKIEEGYDVAITPDGPRGPVYQLNAGAIALAQRTGSKVLPVQVHYSRCWRLKTWDRFQIPKPFSRVDVTFLPLETVVQTEDDEGFEGERARIEEILRDGQVEDWASDEALKAAKGSSEAVSLSKGKPS